MRYFVIIISVLVFLFPVGLTAQEKGYSEKDSVVALNIPDSVDMQLISKSIDTNSVRLKPAFKPNPTRAIIYSAIVPGLGQIYNRKYWKLPIVYGGFLGCAYAITWNSNQYNGYKNAYNDWTDNDPTTNSWANYLRYDMESRDPSTWNSGEIANFGDALKRKRDYYRRYKELSIIITAGVYLLTMLDAYVDAQLYDFDISPDLSMRVEPVLFDKTPASSRSVGLQCSFKF